MERGAEALMTAWRPPSQSRGEREGPASGVERDGAGAVIFCSFHILKTPQRQEMAFVINNLGWWGPGSLFYDLCTLLRFKRFKRI